MENKKSFILYTDLIHTVRKLPNDKAGELFKHILSYVNDEDPETNDLIINISFEPIKQQLKRDLDKWSKSRSKFSNAGKESAKARRLISETQLYVLKFYNNKEEFIKIGVTDLSISRRYSSDGEGGAKHGYKFDIIYQVFQKDLANLTVLDLENKIIKKFEKSSYIPAVSFGGHTECLNISTSENVKQFITTFNNVQQRSTKPTVNVNDNVNVTVNDNVIKKKKVKEKNENFELFWNHFHEHVKQPKSKKEPTLKHWNKLGLDEQRKAYASIKPYSESKHPNEHEYLSIARTYLADKLYNDEYDTTERLPNKEKILELMKKMENEKL